MTATARSQRRDDHDLRELVQTSGDTTPATEHGVPASTGRDWLTKSRADVVSLELFDLNTAQLQHDVVRVR